MEIELAVVPDCPNAEAARQVLRQALAEIELDGAALVTRVVSSEAEAREIGFVGSPSIRFNGQDPFVEPGQQVGLSCRMYRTPAGLRGVPGVQAVRQALLDALTAESP
ncbi:hypothetical protein SacmaDRAFT_0012 [Saccharomonospora marina XMU15]|uniref:Alkylmercury lyase n=1 Tax=Saccharomonospora marina XMU15 TaxID=882083 RepID=H5WX58_9PSEU|nr:hypothetical protein [Saccharomonospora marina]EHR48332.1 hypothetical protein SacmaDRAFT_0012 [Saccharomonospora marina XMU15]